MEIGEWQSHLRDLYGRRNAAFVSNRSRLISYLSVSIGNLAKGYRKAWPKPELELAASSVFGWTMAVANSFEGLPLQRAMGFKWGGRRCVYCDQNPCGCVEDRPAMNRVFDPANKNNNYSWPLSNFQLALREKYLGRNQALGLPYAFGRLFEELGEVTALDAEVAIDQPTVEEIEREYALELADILGWLLSICNLLEIDLETAILKAYGQSCVECAKQPCVCGKLTLQQGRFRRARPFAQHG